jgi:hypothetical protein
MLPHRRDTDRYLGIHCGYDAEDTERGFGHHWLR